MKILKVKTRGKIYDKNAFHKMYLTRNLNLKNIRSEF